MKMVLAATAFDVKAWFYWRPSATIVQTVARYVLEPFMADAVVARM